MKISRCPNPICVHAEKGSGRFYVKVGYFITKWNAQPVPRYRCKACGKTFSSHTFLSTWRQKKPYVNKWVFRLYASAMTQRRMAQVMKLNRKTVVKKFLFLAEQARRSHERYLRDGLHVSQQLHFDEMESFEHTRLKPLSIPLAVDADSGAIVAVAIAQMSAKGRLAEVALRKYGYRLDTRPAARNEVLQQAARVMSRGGKITTDFHASYPALIREILPNCRHARVRSRGEIRFLRQRDRRRNPTDPLYALNHLCAKIRHDLSRMARKVWVTTKKAIHLKDHLDLYIAFHNGYDLGLGK